MTDLTSVSRSRFPELLRSWRQKRRLSQLDLSLAAGLSQRHLSFLETGRSNPSRHSITQLGEALEMPTAEYDTLLVSAGYAALSERLEWAEETRDAVKLSVKHILDGHAPYPAVAIDQMWNLQHANLPALNFFGLMGGTEDRNILRGLMTPSPLREKVVNWDQAVRALLRLLELEAARRPSDAELHSLLGELRALPGMCAATDLPAESEPEPLITIELIHESAHVRLFSTIATIGLSADATIDDLRIETLLPADEDTRGWFHSHADMLSKPHG